MRIKSQFIVTIIFFVGALLIISSSIVTKNEQLTQLNYQEQSARTIQTGASDLNYIANDYFLYQEMTQVNQWQIKLSSISNEISKLNSTNPQQQIIIKNIKTDIQNLDIIFKDTISFLESAPRNVSIRILPAFQGTWSRMTIQNQALAFDASVLTNFTDKQAIQLNQDNTLLILAVLSLFGIYLFVNYLITYRRTLKSMLSLQAGTVIIGSGNLDYRIKSDKKDEIGELANSFNQMAIKLKDITTSKSELTTEISERKKAEEELTNNQIKMKAVNEKLYVVGSLTRHDVGNKLMVIKSNMYLLKKQIGDNPKLARYFEGIDSALASSDNIFEFSRLYEKIGAEKPSKENVFECFNQAAALLPNLGTTLKILNDCHGLEVMADSLLKQLFYNFLDNSLKHGEKVTQIRLHYTNEGDELKMFYEDDGVGILEANKSKLFDSGFTTGNGSGLGLYLIKKMMDVYGWEIEENGEPGKGAKFTITIPKLNKSGKENYQIDM
jgi:signal transduction histidine kinase